MVVEDEQEIAEAIEIYLKTQDYEVIKAENGQRALEIFEEEEIDLILMDLMMPVLDGVQTTIQIRKKSVVPIIMLTAKSEDTDKIWGLNIRVKQTSKPVTQIGVKKEQIDEKDNLLDLQRTE